MGNMDLRSWLEFLKGNGLLGCVKKEVDKRFQLAAIVKKLDGQKTLYFEKVAGYDIPVVSNILLSKGIIAKFLNTDENGLLEKFSNAIKNPTPIKYTSVKDAPVKEVIVLQDKIDLLKMFPIPVHHAKDAGEYISAAVTFANDPETGVRNLSNHRLQVVGKNKLRICIQPRHLWDFYQKAENKGQGLPVAFVLGSHPLIMLGAQAPTPGDELEIANSLMGGNLRTVKGETVDIEYPADAEIVLEGKILPGLREPEAPFGEYMNLYGEVGDRPVVEITCVCYRKKPIFHTLVTVCREHLLLGAIAREAGILQVLRNVTPYIKGVNLSLGGSCRYHLVVSIKQTRAGEAKNVIFAAFAAHENVNHVTVVDEDINIADPVDVEWAIATRCHPQTDMFIIHHTLGSEAVSSGQQAGLVSKVGIDATIPFYEPHEKYEKISIPGMDTLDVNRFLE
jgi:2,5-furandicarboxylate decarboxylase 1